MSDNLWPSLEEIAQMQGRAKQEKEFDPANITQALLKFMTGTTTRAEMEKIVCNSVEAGLVSPKYVDAAERLGGNFERAKMDLPPSNEMIRLIARLIPLNHGFRHLTREFITDLGKTMLMLSMMALVSLMRERARK